MPDYRPIPGQMDTGSMNMPTDDLSRMASERASNLLAPYGEQFGGNGKNRPIVPASSPAGGGGASPSTEDKLYQSIHPDTFSKVLEAIMQFATGKPIPRQEGGPVEPGKEYRVGEAGPERFRASVPGEIIPESPSPMGGTSLTYAGTEGRSPLERGLRQTRGVIDKISPYIGPALSVPLKALGKMTEGVGDFPIPTEQKPYTGPAPWRGRSTYPTTREHEGYGIPREGDWRDYSPEGQPTGIRYKMGPEDVRGDEAARRGVLAEAGRAEEKYGIPIPRKSYYDVHPEERASQEFYDRTRVSPDSYEAGVERFRESNLRDIVQNPNTTKEARTAAAEQLAGLEKSRTEREALATRGAADIYGKGLEYGLTSPGAQEKLAHAEYLRKWPEIHMAGIDEQSKAHLAGIMATVEGHIKAAEISATVKDPLTKEIGALLIQGQKTSEMYGMPFDPQKTISNVLKVYKALGVITDDQWAKIPQEYKEKQWTEQSLRADLKANGMKDKDIETYIKRAKAMGKV